MTENSTPDRHASEQSTARPPTNYREIRRQNDRNLFLAVILFLLIVGGGLIFIFYGAGGLLTGLACLLFGAGLLALLWFILTIIERWANQ